MADPIVCLDTNIWSLIARRSQGSALQAAARSEGIRIAVAPAVVYELLRTPDAKLRARDVELVTRKTWLRLMTEVYQECRDLRLFIEQHHPEWMREDPDLEDFSALERDWSKKGGGFWDRARRNPSDEAARLGMLEGDLVDAAHAEAKMRRRDYRRGGLTFERLNLDSLRAQYNEVDGAPQEVALWRAEAEAYFWTQLVVSYKRRELTAEGDWLWWCLDIDRLSRDRQAWRKMWLEEMTAENVPRNWMRTALSSLQATRKTTRGTPADNQIALYLFEVDILLTGDTNFVDVVNAVGANCPVPLGTAVALNGEADVVSAIVEAAINCTA